MLSPEAVILRNLSPGFPGFHLCYNLSDDSDSESDYGYDDGDGGMENNHEWEDHQNEVYKDLYDAGFRCCSMYFKQEMENILIRNARECLYECLHCVCDVPE